MDVFRVQPVGGASFTPGESRCASQASSDLDRPAGRQARSRKPGMRSIGSWSNSSANGAAPSAACCIRSKLRSTTANRRPTPSWTSGRTIRPPFCMPSPTRSRCEHVYHQGPDRRSKAASCTTALPSRNRYGQKLTDPADQQQLRLTAVLIKQFTHALTWAPDPTKALEAFDQFLDLTVQETERQGPRRGARVSQRQENVSAPGPAARRQRFSVGGLSPPSA